MFIIVKYNLYWKLWSRNYVENCKQKNKQMSRHTSAALFAYVRIPFSRKKYLCSHKKQTLWDVNIKQKLHNVISNCELIWFCVAADVDQVIIYSRKSLTVHSRDGVHVYLLSPTVGYPMSLCHKANLWLTFPAASMDEWAKLQQMHLLTQTHVRHVPEL